MSIVQSLKSKTSFGKPHVAQNIHHRIARGEKYVGNMCVCYLENELLLIITKASSHVVLCSEWPNMKTSYCKGIRGEATRPPPPCVGL